MLAMAGIIGLVSMSGVVGRVIRRAASDLFTSGPASSAGLLRTQQDLPMSQIVTGTLAMCALFTLFFHGRNRSSAGEIHRDVSSSLRPYSIGAS